MTGRRKKSNFRKIWYSPPLKAAGTPVNTVTIALRAAGRLNLAASAKELVAFVVLSVAPSAFLSSTLAVGKFNTLFSITLFWFCRDASC